ncbi:SDR family oxidoreductase [Bacillus sp. KH172YL63]|uniref:SDR family oxidoreductase n=1 Tax=Bacillus sp. KH172YL63 TaxID=2709784 RepID=UPI0013E4B6EE|nr:SDR family NAD(P)-dependent oxidoreductase [Bacillus sp. KH172YL63]BCB02522.1 putative oxidoreductase DltE [Bacillus sp. KH172YL63]
MKLTGNTILITGGASGIGYAFAERFIQKGNRVIICGRNEQKLEAAREKHPGIVTKVCDITEETERIELFDWVTTHHPEVNVLVNNAGIQQRYHVLNTDVKEDWRYYNKEITANIEAPMHFAFLFAPFFKNKPYAAIVNVTSGLAYTPMAIAPIYSATKAALHSFSTSIRLQLSDTGIEVIEVAPPAVNTDLGGVGLHTFGAPVDEFADSIFQDLEAGKTEIGYGRSAHAMKMSRDEIDQAVEEIYENTKKSIE